MKRFLLRRLLLAIPTLFGISLITFALIHLAPGDPGGGGAAALGPASKRDLRSSRRLFFLNLPLFFNARPMGLAARTNRLLEDHVNRGNPAPLRRCGTACLPALARALKAAKPRRRKRLASIVAAVRADHPGLAAGAPEGGWLRSALEALDPRALRDLTQQLGSRPDAVSRLGALGSAALPAAMELLLEGHGAARRRASRVVCQLTGIDSPVERGLPDAEIEQTLDFWSEWWFLHRRDYVSYGWGERLLGRLTETQYAKWLGRLTTLRFGRSTQDGRPVADKLAEAIPITALLSLISMLLAYLIAVPLGVHGAVRRGALSERVITALLFLLYSLPGFWVAMVLILLFGGVGLLDLFPIYGLYSAGLEEASGWTWLVDRAAHLVLPVFCLTYGSLALISRYQRTAMLEVIRLDYIRTARAKGLRERSVIFRHALRNSLLPTITLLGLQLPYLIGGSVIIERIFNIPGMGMLTFDAFLNRDYPVIMAVSVISAVMTLAGLILADLFYAVADPRISLRGQR